MPTSTVTQVRVHPNSKVRLELLSFKLFSRFCLCSGVPCNLTTRRDFKDILGIISYLLKSGGRKKEQKEEKKGEERGEERRGERRREERRRGERLGEMRKAYWLG